MIAPHWSKSIRNTNGQMLRVPLRTSTSPWRSADTGVNSVVLWGWGDLWTPGSDCNIFGRCLIEAHLETYTQDGPGHFLFTDDTKSVWWPPFHPPSKWCDGSGLASRESLSWAAAISCLVTTSGHGVRERLEFNPHNSGVQVKRIALTFTFCWNSLLSIQPKSQSGFLVIKVHS